VPDIGAYENALASATGIIPGDSPELPVKFALFQNAPNPFNPATLIRFNLPKRSLISLRIYDVAGRLVADLVNGWRDAGSHAVTFDGSGLASGVYLYRIEAGEFSAVSKMVLMK
jgi:hypothetical protein